MKNIYALLVTLTSSTTRRASASTIAETYIQKSKICAAAATVGLVFAAAPIDLFQLAIPPAQAGSHSAGLLRY